MISVVASNFCLALAFGICATLLALRPSDLEPKFFRTNAIVAVVLAVAGLFLHSDAPKWAWVPVGILGTYSALLIALPRQAERYVLTVATLGLGLTILESGHGSRWLALSTLAGGLVTGSAVVSMNVGHWYLSAVKLTMRPLRTAVTFLAIAIAFRIVWDLGAGMAIAQGTFPWRPEDLTMVTVALIRVLFGLLGPALLVWMTWQTVKLEATQSATGILYALLAMVLAGEASALYLGLTGGLPL